MTRGICKMDKENNLTEVVETKNIVKTVTGVEADGVVVDVNSLVSMNQPRLQQESRNAARTTLPRGRARAGKAGILPAWFNL